MILDGIYVKLLLVTVMAIKAAQTVNIALGKAAYQSSVTAGGVPSRAVDGDSDSDFCDGSFYSSFASTSKLTSMFIFCFYVAQTVNIALGKPAYQSSLTGGGLRGRAVDGDSDSDFFNGTKINFYVYVLYSAAQTVNIALGKPAYQSSLTGGGLRGRAVDGDSDSDFFNGTKINFYVYVLYSAVQTVNIALGKPAYQSSLTGGGLRGRAVDGDSDSDFFNGTKINFYVYVLYSAVQTVNIALGKPAYQSSLTGGGLRGRAVDGDSDSDFFNGTKINFYVYVLYSAAQTVNIALGKPAYQSSVTEGGVPGKAVDDNFNGNFGGGSCIHTLHGEIEQWWVVDLQGVYPITDVFIQNRNAYPNLHNFVVEVFPMNPIDESEEGKLTCSNYSGVAPNAKVHLPCENGTVGRYVRLLKLPEFITNPSTDTLIICEVVVETPESHRPCGSVRNIPGSANSSKTSGEQIIQGLSRLQCLHLCYYDYKCHGFNFREPDGICQKITDEDQPMVPNTDWMYYSLI